MPDPAVLDEDAIREAAAEHAEERAEEAAAADGKLDAEPGGTVEIVAPEPPEPPRNTALDRAATAAMADPGMPGAAEFMNLCLQARVIADSALAPKDLRGKPHDVLMILMVGRDLGISITSALNLVYVVDGKPSLAPKLLNSRIRRLGLGKIINIVQDPDRATSVAVAPGGAVDMRCRRSFPQHWWEVEDVHPNTPEDRRVCLCTPELWLGDMTFTWADAQRAGMVRRDCEADAHSPECDRLAESGDWKQRAKACKQNYRTYPQRMCRWRADGWLSDDVFPEAALGLYDPDSLGAMTDGDGNLIDVDSVEVPEGFRKGLPPGPTNTEAPDEDKNAVKARVDRLILADHYDRAGLDETAPTAREAFLALWEKSLPPWKKLTAAQIKTANAMIESVEARARKGEFGVWTPPADPETGEIGGNSPSTEQQTSTSAPVEAPSAEGNSPETPQDDERAPDALDTAIKPDSVTPPETTASEQPPAAPEADGEATAPPVAPTAPEPTPPTPTGPEPDRVQRIIDEVGAMGPGAVRAELAKRNLPTGGAEPLRKQRLAQAMLEAELAAEAPPEPAT